MKPCPRCREKLQDGAAVCRFCRHEFSPSALAAEERSVMLNRLFILGLVVVVGIAAVRNWPGGDAVGKLTDVSAVADQGLATAAPLTASIKGWTWGFSASGQYCKGAGTVLNTSSQMLRGLTFTVQLFDKRGRLLTSDTGNTDVIELDPGSTSPFSFFARCPANTASASLTATQRFGERVTLKE